MDDLTRYIERNLSYLMNDVERRAHTGLLMRRKAQAAEGTSFEKRFDDWIPAQPEVVELMAKGYDGLIDTVRERVLREDKDRHYLNYCPHCGSLARTPSAKQCPKCFFSWHDSK